MRNRAYRIALVSAAAPLVVGIAIFLLWLPTGWRWLAAAGAITLVAGPVFFLVGMAALFRSCWGDARTALGFCTPESRRAAVCALLLVANFPVAGGILAAVWKIRTSYTVVVRNESPLALEDVELSGGGVAARLGTIPPGRVVRRWLWFRHEGELELHARGGGVEHTRIIEDYVYRRMHGRTTVTWHPDGTVTVTRDPP